MCAIWNPSIGLHGAWDTDGVETVSVRFDPSAATVNDASGNAVDTNVAVCKANTMGTFAVIAEVQNG